jgi:RNA polymerase sigma-70 factor (ECF subfamily)
MGRLASIDLDQQEATERFYDLIWPHRAVVLRNAQILTRNVHEAEDLAQETMIKAFKGIKRFAPGSHAKNWLMVILRNCRIDRLRAAGNTAKDLSLDQLPFEPAGATTDASRWDVRENPQEVLNRFSDQEIIDGLQQLPEEIRWTLLLVDVEGLDQQETADILDVPVGTIKSRAHRGRAMLRQVLLPVAKERRLT